MKRSNKKLYEQYINKEFLDTVEEVEVSYTIRKEFVHEYEEGNVKDELVSLFDTGPNWHENGSWFTELDNYEDAIIAYCFESLSEINDGENLI